MSIRELARTRLASQARARSKSATRRLPASSRRQDEEGTAGRGKEPAKVSRGCEDRWTTGKCDDHLRQHWAKHEAKYNHVCQVKVAEGESSIAKVFEEQPDHSELFGIRCKVCSVAYEAGVITKSVWTNYEYRGSTVNGVRRIQCEDLLRHCNISKSQRKGSQKICKAHEKALAYARARHVAKDEIRDLEQVVAKSREEHQALDAPSAEQIKFAVQLAWGWGGQSLKDYERRCADSNSCPKTRSSPFTARKILIAGCEVLYESDREEILPKAVEAGWAQDGKDGHLYIKYRAVSADFTITERMLDLVEAKGDRSLQCNEDMRTSLERLCSEVVRDRVVLDAPCPAAGNASADTESHKTRAKYRLKRILEQRIMSHFQKICKNANADGAPNEQLALRFSKALALLPGLDFITRAEEHNCHLALKNSSEQCGWLDPLTLS